MAAQKIDKETCLAEFERFCEAMRLQHDIEEMDQETREEYEEARRPILKALARGNLVIDDDGRATLTIPEAIGGTDRFVFRKPTGATLKAMDTEKKGKDIGKMFACMAQLTQQPASSFNKMDMPDLAVCQSITTLFLAPQQ